MTAVVRKVSIALGLVTALAAFSCRRTPLDQKGARDAGRPSISDAGRGEPLQGEVRSGDPADATDAPADRPDGGVCAFDTTYNFTSTGGLGVYRDSFSLSPAATYVHYRNPEGLPGVPRSCSPAIPTCDSPAIDAADLTAALADPDVQEAFTRSLGAGTFPFYGEDQRGGDGPAWQVTRAGGGGFLMGAPCPTSSTRPCTAIPPGMTRLVQLLIAFDQQQMTDPSCAFNSLGDASVDGAPAMCFLDATYRYGYDGGRIAWRDTVILSPPTSFLLLHQPVTTMPPDMQCMPLLPMCDGPAIDLADVMAALADPEVQQVLIRSKGAATLPLYGVDPRPSDGQIFQLTTDLGGGFLVGTPCPPGPGTFCVGIPEGLARLVSVLDALERQQLADPTCASLFH
jgi:hypothetical protein